MIKLNSDNLRINNWAILLHYDDDLDKLLIAEKKLIENSENFSKTLIEEFLAKVENDVELKIKPVTYQEGSIQAQYYGYFYGDTEKLNNQILQNYRKASID